MEMALGMSEAETNTTGFRGTDQGAQMKMDYGWFNDGNGTNSSGFSSLPAGKRPFTGGFIEAGTASYFWTSSLINTYCWARRLEYDREEVYRWGMDYSGDRNTGFSIRCIKDSE